MKGRLGKFGTIFLALALCLAITGAGFAKWSDTVTIEGTVNTGTVCLEFSPNSFMAKDSNVPPPPYEEAATTDLDWTCEPGFVYGSVRQLDKNVGWTTGVFSDTDGDTHLDVLTVIINNAYPCYYNEISAKVHNCGTIPIKLCECQLTYPDPNNPGSFITVPLPDGTLVYIPGEDQYGGISNVIELIWLNNTGKQLEPCEEAEDSWEIHVLQAAKQGFTYTFTITRDGVQWNEYP
jgi:hypothetical protein